MLIKSTTAATVSALDIEAFAAAVRVAEIASRVQRTRRDQSADVSDSDIQGILDAATHGDAELRERVIRILQAGR